MKSDAQKIDRYRNVVDVIRRRNALRDRDPIPVLGDLIPQLDQEFFRDRTALQACLDLLVEARYLIAFRLVEADPRLRGEAVSGYVVAEADVVRDLKTYIFGLLESAYEQQFYRRRTAVMIIQEMLQDIRKYNNSHIGRILNAAVMLQQYEQLLDRGSQEYLPAARETRLAELLRTQSPPDQSAAPAASDETDPRRASDTPSGAEAEQMDLSGEWGQAVEKFGVEFLLRIHFRKNEFNKIKYLVNTRRVARESDLIFIRDTVRTLQNRALEKQDPDLRLHLTALQNLLASVHVKLQMIALERKRD